MPNVPPNLADLNNAAGHLLDASNALRLWRERADDSVKAGHASITSIDATVQELQDQRARLVAEIRADEIDRAARVDALLAYLDDERINRRLESFAEREDSETGAPLPPDVEGYAPGRSNPVTLWLPLARPRPPPSPFVAMGGPCVTEARQRDTQG